MFGFVWGFHLLILSLGKAACKSRLTGLMEELKHIDKELKSNTPDPKEVTMAYDIQILQLLSELSIILQIVKAAIQALLYKVFHTKLVITFPVGNCCEDAVQ